MNLIHDAWLPVRRRSGVEERIAPWQVAERLEDGPVVALASPRADFDGALAQFLIGLLQTAISPADDAEWRLWLTRPDPARLRQALEPLAPAFELFGAGPRFLQDLTLTEESPREEAIERLLIDAPGESTARLGKDHFVKAGRIRHLCAPCAATALLTLQVNAPSGGQGHRTGIRGGGPLTTLVVHPRGLWPTLWMNVLTAGRFAPGRPGASLPTDRFPWLAPTRTSERGTGRETTREDVDPLQVYWAMPRRIRLLAQTAEPGEGAPACDLCAEAARPAVSRYLTLNLGVNYTGPWEHPLTPHGIDLSGLPFPLKGGQAGPSYRHWLGLVQGSAELRRRPAQVVVELDRRTGRRAGYRLWVFGYDMDNMKARAWIEGRLPLASVEPALRPRYEGQAAALVLAARYAERALAEAARGAVSARPQDLAGDPGDLPARFWEETEVLFLDHLRQLRQELSRGGDGRAVRASWHYGLNLTTREIFELFCGHGPAATAAPRRVALAWKGLEKALLGPRMFDLLDLTSPQNALGTERGASRHERLPAAAPADRLPAVKPES